MKKVDKESFTIIKEIKSMLNELLPDIIEDEKINFQKLKLMLGEEINDFDEKYQFTWKGKSNSIKLAQTPTITTLRPSKEESEDWENTKNLYIEGDNLEVLKQLQKTYFGKIKVIYIDPPYNTGGDFVYKDDFKNSLRNYKEQTKQSKSSNAETNGRFHTDWLNMIYPRLMLAKNILSKEGVIFISIDENEQENLKKISDEIFGETNFIGTLIWENRTAPNDAGTNFGVVHEYVLIYSKNSKNIHFKGIEKDFSNYKNPDNDPNGPWIKDNPSAASGTEKSRFEIVNPFTNEVYLPPKGRYWGFSEKRVEEWTKTGKLVFPKESNSNFILKKYKSELRNQYNPFSSIIRSYFTMHGTKEFKFLFSEGSNVFKYPKPSGFIKSLIEQVDDKNLTILDFFSGSATTAHAVMKLNAEDGGNRKFIMIQLPEKTDEKSEAYKAGYKNICEIGKERIRRAGQQIKQELIDIKNNTGILDGNLGNPESLDIGFKVFKLDETNIKAWDSSKEVTKQTLLDQVEVIKENRSKEDVLYEVLLKYGIFNQTVKEITINNKIMYDIADGYMIVNLSEKIEDNDVKQITKRNPNVVIFLESGFFNDNDKINAEATLKHNGVEEVKCI